MQESLRACNWDCNLGERRCNESDQSWVPRKSMMREPWSSATAGSQHSQGCMVATVCPARRDYLECKLQWLASFGHGTHIAATLEALTAIIHLSAGEIASISLFTPADVPKAHGKNRLRWNRSQSSWGWPADWARRKPHSSPSRL